MVDLYMTIPSAIPGRPTYPFPIYLDDVTAAIRRAEGRITDFPYDLYRSAEEYLAVLDNKN